MGFSVVVASAVRNLVSNPSGEADVAGWSGSGATPGTVSQSSTRAYRGRYAIRIAPDVSTNSGGKYTLAGLTIGVEYTASAYIWGNNGVGYDMRVTTTAGTLLNSTTWTATDAWRRRSVTFTATATTHEVRFWKVGADVLAFNVDALQVEAGAAMTDYCDGDQDGCYWLNTPHAGMSERDGQSRAGGRAYTFAELGWSEAAWTGLGLPPMRHTAEPDPFHGGGRYQATAPKERTIVLTLWHSATSVATLHDARKLLTDALGPKVLARDQPFLLRCDLTGATPGELGATAEILCVYDDGLGPSLDKGFQQTVQLRLLAFEPRWRGLKDEAATLDQVDTSTARYAVARSGVAAGLSTAWDVLGLTNNPTGSTGPTILVDAFAEGPDGCVYIAGDFLSWNTLGANYKGVVKFDPVTRTYSALGTGIAGRVYCLMFDSLGRLWAGGDFAGAGGVANTALIARWTGSAWESVGGAGTVGFSVRAIVQGHDGYVYVTGVFTQLGATAAAYIARWNLDSGGWFAMGTGLNAGVAPSGQALVVGPDGTVYVTGIFTTVNAVPAISIAQYNAMASSPVWSALGSGLQPTGGGTGEGYALAMGRDKMLYAGGNFDTAGGVAAYNIARWGGRSWSALGGGTGVGGGYVHTLATDPMTGDIYVAGAFATMGGIPMADALARWNGRAWVHLDLNLPGTLPGNYARGVYVTRRGVPFIGFDNAAAMRAAGTVAVTIDADAEVYPRLVFARSAGGGDHVLEMIRNETTGLEIPLRLPIQDGETVVLDLRRPVPYVASSLRGDVTAVSVREGGNFDGWSLRRGVNNVSAFVNGANATTAISAWMIWRNSYLALDAVQP